MDGTTTTLVKHSVPEKHRKDRAHVARMLYALSVDSLANMRPLSCFIEEPLVAGARNLQSSLKIAQVCGVMLTAAGMERVDTVLVPVSSWKKGTIGNGSTNKDGIRAWLDTKHPQVAQKCGHDQDLYDAACIALHGQGLLKRVGQLGHGLQDEP